MRFFFCPTKWARTDAISIHLEIRNLRKGLKILQCVEDLIFSVQVVRCAWGLWKSVKNSRFTFNILGFLKIPGYLIWEKTVASLGNLNVMEYMRAKNWGSSKLNICHQKASNRETSYKSLKKAMSNTKMHPSFNEQSISFRHSRGTSPPRSLFCVSYFSLVSHFKSVGAKMENTATPYLWVHLLKRALFQVKSNSFQTLRNNFMANSFIPSVL